MALKAVLSKTEVDALPEAVRGLYKDNNGAFTLDVEGMVAEGEVTKLKTSLKEFRENNITIAKERDTLKKDHDTLKTQLSSFDGVDAEEYKTLKEKTDKLKKSGVERPEDLANLISAQIDKVTKPLKDQMNSITQERDQTKIELGNRTRDDQIRSAALKAGARENALDDVLNRGRQVFQFRDGKVVAMDGDKPMFDGEGNALTAENWISGLAKNADFLFKPSGGSGAEGGAGNKGSAAKVLKSPSAYEFGQNLADIASGKTEVQMNG